MNRVMEDTGGAAGPGSHGELEAIPVLLAQQATPTSVTAIGMADQAPSRTDCIESSCCLTTLPVPHRLSCDASLRSMLTWRHTQGHGGYPAMTLRAFSKDISEMHDAWRYCLRWIWAAAMAGIGEERRAGKTAQTKGPPAGGPLACSMPTSSRRCGSPRPPALRWSDAGWRDPPRWGRDLRFPAATTPGCPCAGSA